MELEEYEGALDIERAWREGLVPDPLLSVSEWSDRHRMLSSKASSEPGRWRTSRTPYLKEIMDCLSPTSPVERVVFMKAAQLGATEMGSNWIGYVIHHAPGPMMAVWPTVEMAKRNSKQRIDPLIEESLILKELIAPARSRDSGNTILAKEYRGGVLVMTGANSAVGLRSMPVRYLFLDEVDGYPLDVDGEGNAVALAEARTRTFARRKIFIVSTPTIAGVSTIEREYEASDQRSLAGSAWVQCASAAAGSADCRPPSRRARGCPARESSNRCAAPAAGSDPCRTASRSWSGRSPDGVPRSCRSSCPAPPGQSPCHRPACPGPRRHGCPSACPCARPTGVTDPTGLQRRG